MNGVHHNDKYHDFEKMYPGCLGKMVDLFELNIGTSANRLLDDTPHREGSPFSRSRSDVPRMSPSGDPLEEKVIVLGPKSRFPTRKSNGTPMKMLIAQEMSPEVDSKRDPPNLVAKLMGLDALPQHEPGPTIQRSHSRVHPRSNLDIPMSYSEQQDGFFNYIDPNGYKDVRGRCQQSQKSLHTGRYEETVNDKKMTLVRQKFIEAKRLSTDEKLRHSKQFQDALDVLSSNKDLFLKCLQEPNSMFSQHVYGRQSVPPPETKRITVLRPSKVADSNDFAGASYKDEKQIRRGAFLQASGLEKIHQEGTPAAGSKYNENSAPPTRIVVLKPSPRQLHDVNSVGSPQSKQPRILLREEFFGDEEDDENQESREVAKIITQQMREKLGEHRRDETLISSVFSNGYVGDESSFNKSEIERADGNFSDLEVMSPVSRNSWDYPDRFSSPFSSSFTRASYSPESSVCREAKKRLSERWAMMAYSGSCQEQRHLRRSSSTLGEMLTISETKKESSLREEITCFEEPMNSDSLLVSEQRREENVDYLPRDLMRSKSVPVSSTEFGTRLNVGVSVSDKRIPESPKEDTKARSVKSSFRGKVSSLFFSRNKKPGKSESLVSETKVEVPSFHGEICRDKTGSLSEKGLAHATPGLLEPNRFGKQGMISPEIGLAVAEPIASGNTGENLDEPSPISVFDRSFEEDEHITKVLPHYVKPNQHGVEPTLNSIVSNLIDKSPPIGSISRTLSWDNSCVNTTSLHPTNESLTTHKIDEEQELFFFVKTLLSVAGLQGEVQSNSFFGRWHSPGSPLNPSLRDNYIDLKDEQTFHEAKKRQNRSIQKLAFDSVNEALIDIAGYESDSSRRDIPNGCILDETWARVKVCVSGEVHCVSGDCGADNSLRVVRKEVVGKGWNGNFKSEMDILGKEIGGTLLEELVLETVVELTGRI